MRSASAGLLVLQLASCGGDRALPEANPLAAPPLALEISAEEADRWPHRRYEGPGRATAGSSAYYQIESWLPGSARLTD